MRACDEAPLSLSHRSTRARRARARAGPGPRASERIAGAAARRREVAAHKLREHEVLGRRHLGRLGRLELDDVRVEERGDGRRVDGARRRARRGVDLREAVPRVARARRDAAPLELGDVLLARPHGVVVDAQGRGAGVVLGPREGVAARRAELADAAAAALGRVERLAAVRRRLDDVVRALPDDAPRAREHLGADRRRVVVAAREPRVAPEIVAERPLAVRVHGRPRRPAPPARGAEDLPAHEGVGDGRRAVGREVRGQRRAATGVQELVDVDHRLGRKRVRNSPTLEAPISVDFRSFRLIFGRAIISRSVLEAWMLFRNGRARNTHVESTLNHSFPALFSYRMLSSAYCTFVDMLPQCMASTKRRISSCVMKPFLSRSKT